MWALMLDKPGNSVEDFRVKHSWIITIGSNFFPPQIFSLYLVLCFWNNTEGKFLRDWNYNLYFCLPLLICTDKKLNMMAWLIER